MTTDRQSRSFATRHEPVFRWSLLAPRYWGNWIGWLFLGAMRFVPRRLRAWLAAGIAEVLLRLPSSKREDAEDNLMACFPELDDAGVRDRLRRHVRIQLEVYLGLGALIFESRERLLQRFEVHGLEQVQAASAAGTGVMLLVPHTCAFEWAGQCIAMLNPVVSMARLHKDNPARDWMVNRMRLRFGGLVFGNEQSMVPLIKAVRSGYWMFYLPDEDRRNANGVFAPFFGVPKLTIPSIGRLATACRARVFPLQVCYQPESGKVRLDFLPPLENFPSGDAEADARLMNQTIELVLSADPAQYAWTQRIFRSRPPGEPKVYGPYGIRSRRPAR